MQQINPTISNVVQEERNKPSTNPAGQEEKNEQAVNSAVQEKNDPNTKSAGQEKKSQNPNPVGQKQNKQEFEDRLYETLKRIHKTVDVSAAEVQQYLLEKKLNVPKKLGGFDGLMETMYQKYGEVFRNNGEGTKPERYLVLHKTLPIPQEIREKVYGVTVRFFADRLEVANVEVGQVFRKNGINFKQFQYPDLTSFLRNFTEIFTIVATKKNNVTSISVRINQAMLKELAGKYEDSFKLDIKELNEQLEKENYRAILSEDILRKVMEENSIELWEAVIKAIARLEEKENQIPVKEELTDWEKSVISLTQETADKLQNSEMTGETVFSKEQITLLKENLNVYPEVRRTFSAIGMRIQNVCGRDNILAYYFYQMGILGGLADDKNYSCRFLTLFCADYQEKVLQKIWDQYKNFYIDRMSLDKLVHALYDKRYFEKVIYIVESRPQKLQKADDYAMASVYYEYAKAALGRGSVENLPGLDTVRDVLQVNVIEELLGTLLEQKRTQEFCLALFSFLHSPDKYVSKQRMDDFLMRFSVSFTEKWEELLAEVKNEEFASWFVVNYLVKGGFINKKEEWEAYGQEYYHNLAEVVKHTISMEEKQAALDKLMLRFPEDEMFWQESYESLREKLNHAIAEEKRIICGKLLNAGNEVLIIWLYEKKETQLEREAWFLGYVSKCYYRADKIKEAVLVKYQQVQLLTRQPGYMPVLGELLVLISEGYLRGTGMVLGKELAESILRASKVYQCKKEQVFEYLTAIMGLTLEAEWYMLTALLYCLLEYKDKEMYPVFVNRAKDIILSCWKKREEYRLGNLLETYNHIVNTEDHDTILLYARFAAKVLNCDDSFHKDPEYYKIDAKDKAEKKKKIAAIDPVAFTKMCIVNAYQEISWRVLATYSIERGKFSVNHAANLLAACKYNELEHSMKKCVEHHNDWAGDLFPKNFLVNNLEFLKCNLEIPNYWRSFDAAITRNESFVSESKELAAQYYKAIAAKDFISRQEGALALTILEQTNTYEEFSIAFFGTEAEEKFEKALLVYNPDKFPALMALKLMALFICNDNWSGQVHYLEKMRNLRERLNKIKLVKQDGAILLWIDALFAMRGQKDRDENFSVVSGEILKRYQNLANQAIVKSRILVNDEDFEPNYRLIRYWVNTVDHANGLLKANNYLLSRKLPQTEEERSLVYELLLSIIRRIMESKEAAAGNLKQSYLRICKNYLALGYLANRKETESEDFKNKRERLLTKKGNYGYYLEYKESLDKFWASKLDEELKIQVVYSGITMSWNYFLDQLLYNEDAIKKLNDAGMKEYIYDLDFRSFRVRLLKMYLYMNVAKMQIDHVDTKEIIMADSVPEIEQMKKSLESGTLSFERYLSGVQNITDHFCPEMGEVLHYISNETDVNKKIEGLKAVSFVQLNRGWEPIASNMIFEDEELYQNVIIPCLLTTQYGEDIAKVTEEWAYTQNHRLEIFLKDERIKKEIVKTFDDLYKEKTDNFINDYYWTVYWISNKDYEKAAESFALLTECPFGMQEQYTSLKHAIDTHGEMAYFQIFEDDVQKIRLPKMSFMKSTEPEMSSFEQLVSDFNNAEHSVAAETKCEWAQKIYYYLLEGNPIGDVYGFLYHWGFAVIDSVHDVELKGQILFELLDHMQLLQNKNEFKNALIQTYIYLLNEYSYALFVRHIEALEKGMQKLYKEFHVSYEGLSYYLELVQNLAYLISLSKKDYDAEKLKTEIDTVKNRIQEVREEAQGIYFARKSKDFIEYFENQLNARGLFEIRVLNEDGFYNDRVFYQIKNVGFETISKLELSLRLDGTGEKGKAGFVKIHDKIKAGLRPGQIFAGEFNPEVTAEEIGEGNTVTINLLLEYWDKEESLARVTKSEPLTVKSEEYIYEKSDYAGYSENTITSSKAFIERKAEMKEIVSAINKNEDVVLYGTNGTGKSSILNCLEDKQIPECCEEQEVIPIILHFRADPDMTEEKAVNGLLDVVCGEALLKKVERVYEDVIDISPEEERKNQNAIKVAKGRIQGAINDRTKLVIVEDSKVDSNAIVTIFEAVAEALEKIDAKLFVLWDNFEQMIAFEEINPKYMGFLKTLKESKAAGRIVFVISGSNYLLEVINNEQGDASWNTIFARSTHRVKIGNMENSDFENLMKQKKALNKGEIYYTQAALDYLWQYTNGHAFYSCVLGNRILKWLDKKKVNRRCIYPSDVSCAIYEKDSKLLDRSSEIAIDQQIFKDITDNVEVKCVGRTLAEFIMGGSHKVLRSTLQEEVLKKRPDMNEVSFTKALTCLLNRDFIKEVEEDNSGNNRESLTEWQEYTFTSDLYLERFVDIYVPEIEKAAKKESLWEAVGKASDEERESLRKLMGHNVSGDVIDNRVTNTFKDNAQQINNVQVNIQNMTNALTTIISGATGKELLEAYENLPKLEQYREGLLSVEDKAAVENYKEEMANTADEERCNELQEKIDEIEAPVQEQMYSDYKEAIVKADDSLLESLDDKRLAEILNIEEDQLEPIRLMPSEFQMQFNFATVLHNIFQKMEEDIEVQGEENKIDYCPVVLLYCKVVEAILKKMHTPVYIQKFPNEKVGSSRFAPKFKELQNESKFEAHKTKLTIGTFAFQIAIMDYENVNNSTAKEDVIEEIWTDLRKQRKWKSHAKAIAKVLYYRNKSAHDSDPILKAGKDDLIEVLFRDGELLRMIELGVR